MIDLPEDTEDHALAGEYVLGLLEGEARIEFETRLQAEAGLRMLVRDWTEDLSVLADGLDETPPADLQARVERRIFGGQAAADRSGLRDWLLGALAGGLAVAAVALVLIALPRLFDPVPQMPQAPSFTARIAAEDDSLLIRAAYDAAERRLYLERVAGDAPVGRVLELWLIAGQDAPVSLGVLPAEGRLVLPITPEQGARLAGATLAVSDEPPGGSPTGAPTGAVLAAGQITDT